MDTIETLEYDRLVAAARVVRGVVAAALVTGAGEVVASDADEDAVLEQMQLASTNALAAAEAFSDLLPGDEDQSITVVYQAGHPLMFTPVKEGQFTLVVALESTADIGRARFQLKRLAAD